MLTRWERSAADARVLRDALTRDDSLKVLRGEHTETFTLALQDVLNMDYEVENDTTDGGNYISHGVEGDVESMSATHTLSSKPSVVKAINNLATITKDTMKDLIKELATEEKISNAQEKVLDALMMIAELTEEEKVLVAELLADNYNKLSLFLCLNDKGKLSLAKRLLGGGLMAMEIIYLMDRNFLVLFTGFVYLFGGFLPSNCFTVIGPGGLMAMEVIYLMDRDYLVLFVGFIYLFGGFLPSNCFTVIGPGGVLTDWRYEVQLLLFADTCFFELFGNALVEIVLYDGGFGNWCVENSWTLAVMVEVIDG
ncbi:hypothetical protein ZIOFF_047898 [Zingiber officinale]|uniref:Uncharacterized protein n=1 Tax=Zingiber officinale TaxID=94328 RepID=A0A8J5FYR3_ZINOF|nr:hypothetical protein ZIOFF_047898 [Zingiber officinale]